MANDIEALVSRRSGLTETALAEALFGASVYQQRVNSTCRRLIKQGRLERHGSGGVSDPFTYSLKVDRAPKDWN
jgi:hypothetical protein